ncbi:MAG: diacylglycerol kinase family lipid kinase [Polyangiales bacterium]
MIDPARTVVIVNPAAAGGSVRRRAVAIESLVRDALGPVSMRETSRAGDGVALARDALAQGATAVLSLGGDGTHHEVVSGCLASGVDPSRWVYGALPAGTGGDFTRMLPYGRDLAAAARSVASGAPRWIDVGEVDFTGDSGEPASEVFLNVASCGASGEVDRAVNASAKRWGAVSFLAATVEVMARYRPPRVRVTVDGVDHGEHRPSVIAVCNGQWAGGGMRFAPEASLDDGALDGVVVPWSLLWRSVFDTPKLYAGELLKIPGAASFRGREVRVEVIEGEARMDIDGESPGRATAVFRVRPRALRLLGMG